MRKVNKCGNLPNQSTYKNALSWLIQQGYISRTDKQTVLDYPGLMNKGLPALRNRGIEYGYTGIVGSFSNNGQHFYLSEQFFNDIENGVTNIGVPSPEFVDNQTLTSTLEVLDEELENGIDNITESFFDSDYLANEAALREQEGEVDEDVSYAVFSFDETTLPPPTDNDPVNFSDWYNIRVGLLDRLDRTKNSLLRQKAPREEIMRVNASISKLEEEIASFDPNDIENVHPKVIEEIEFLTEVLNLAISDAPGAAKALVNNEVQERIELLDKHFSSTTYDTSDGFTTSYHLNRGLKEEDILKLRGKISNLKAKYEKNVGEIVSNIVNNTDNMLIAKEVMSPEEFKEYQEVIKEVLDPDYTPEKGIDTFRKRNTLGGKSFGDVLIAVLSVERDVVANREAGITGGWANALGEAWKNLRNRKINGEYVVDRFFQRDAFGQRKSKLITPFNPDFYKSISQITQRARSFAKADPARKPIAYKSWMKNLRYTTDFIDLSRIASAAGQLKNAPEYQEFFTHTAQEMADYEADMRSKMGDTAFEIELQKQLEGAQNYLSDSFTSDAEQYRKNPLRFVKHFYSAENGNPDSTTNLYLEPSYHYAKFIPKLDSGNAMNPEFQALEKELGEDFKNFYTNANNLMQYTKSVFDSERALGNLSARFDHNDIINIQENYNTEAVRQIAFFGPIYGELKNWLGEITKRFSSGVFQKTKVNKFDDISLKTHFNSYGSTDHKAMVDLLTKLPKEDLIKRAKNLRLNIPATYLTHNGVGQVKELAEAIATAEVNKKSSLDIHKRIMAGVKLAESIKTRREVLASSKLFNSYFKIADKTAEADYLHKWVQLNISQEGILKTDSWVSKVERTSILGMKSLSSLDKTVKDIIQDIQEKQEAGESIDYDFHLNGGHYYLDNNGLPVRKEGDVETPISEEVMEKAFETYLNTLIEGLGRDITVGTVIGGALTNFRASALSLNPASGITNREAGYHQNNQAAASGLNGFDPDNLTISRRFLTGARTVNTIEYSPMLAKVMGLRHLGRHKQWGILEYLADNLRLLENVMGDLDLGDGTVIKKGSWKNFLSDFAVNNAEFHNQMEILVSMMQNTMIEKKESDGTISMVPLFNPKTMKFPFDPETKKLLPAYRTPNNISNWEDFNKSEEGKVGHTALATKYQALKHKLHGNYDTNDKLGIEATITGRAAIAFQKWLFENFENEWGSKKVDFVTGEINVKGRKVVLAEHTPTLLLHMGLQNLFTSSKTLNKMTAIFIGLGGLGIVATPAAIGSTMLLGLLPLIYIKRKNIFSAKGITKLLDKTWKTVTFQNEKMAENAKNEAILAMSYTMEILARTLRTSIVSTTGIPLIKEKHVRAMSLTGSPGALGYRNLSEKERNIISENAQQIADKLSSMFRYMMIGTVAKAMYTLASAKAGDDEEEFLKKMEKFEGYLKFLINKQHQTQKELEAMTNPASLAETIQTRVFLDWLSRNSEGLSKMKDFANGDKNFEDVLPDVLGATLKLSLGIPNTALKVLAGENIFKSRQVYDTENLNFMNNYLLESHLPEAEKSQNHVESYKRKLTKGVTKYLKADLEEQLEETGTRLSDSEKERVIRKAVADIMEKEELRFEDKNSVDWISLDEKEKNLAEDIYKYKDYRVNLSDATSSSKSSSKSSSRTKRTSGSSRTKTNRAGSSRTSR